MRSATKDIALFFCGFLGFFLLRDFSLEGGDTRALLNPEHPEMAWNLRFSFPLRYPLSHFLTRLTYLWTDSLPSAFELVSSFCGGLWLLILGRFRRSGAFWVINLTAIVSFLFMGHKEFYAPVAAALTLYYYLLYQSLRPGSRIRPWRPVLAWGVAMFAHKLAFFYLPALALLFFDPRRRKLRPVPKRDIEIALLVFIGILLLSEIPSLSALLIDRDWSLVTQIDNPLRELITLPKFLADPVAERSIRGAFQIFYFGSLDHFCYFFGFLAIGAPLGWAILLSRPRRVFATPETTPLALATLCGLIWAFFWHPHMGWLDWDLFATAALPVNLLAGLLISKPLGSNASRAARDKHDFS